MKLKKLVAIEPVLFLPEGKKEAKTYCEEAIFYETEPVDSQEIISRIGDADGILVSFKNKIGAEILSACPNLKYIGMCCSLYSEASCNVDIRYARERGITVAGIRDYGDEGVAEYIVGELIQMLHGTKDRPPFFGEPCELLHLKVGMLGMGAVAQCVAGALAYFGADICYYSRTRKPEMEQKGYEYRELDSLLQTCDVICSCLSKNVVLLHRQEFEQMGEHKILFNTSLSPSFDLPAIKEWLKKKNTFYFCDTLMGLGFQELLEYPNVFCQNRPAGTTRQAIQRLNEKVLKNLKEYTAMA